MKYFFSLVLASALFLHVPLASAASFSDVSSIHANKVAIDYLVKEGVFKGYEDGSFKPEKILNKAEALKIIIEGGKLKTNDTIQSTSFRDITPSDWFAKYVEKAKELGIVSGNPDGTFTPGKTVTRAEFLKMLLKSNGFKADPWKNQAVFSDVPTDAWFNPYLNYAGSTGLLIKDAQNNLYPGKELSRGEVAEILYLLTVIIRGKQDVQFLIAQSEAQMVQIESYMAGEDIIHAKRSAELAVDFTQQAYKILPANNVVLGAAKLARAYDFVLTGFIAGVQKNKSMAEEYANKAIAKADEAVGVYKEIESIAAHIKNRAQDILQQVSSL